MDSVPCMIYHQATDCHLVCYSAHTVARARSLPVLLFVLAALLFQCHTAQEQATPPETAVVARGTERDCRVQRRAGSELSGGSHVDADLLRPY